MNDNRVCRSAPGFALVCLKVPLLHRLRGIYISKNIKIALCVLKFLPFWWMCVFCLLVESIKGLGKGHRQHQKNWIDILPSYRFKVRYKFFRAWRLKNSRSFSTCPFIQYPSHKGGAGQSEIYWRKQYWRHCRGSKRNPSDSDSTFDFALLHIHEKMLLNKSLRRQSLL